MDLEKIETSLIPEEDNLYNLGSPTKKWRSLYVSGSTIYVGGNSLGVDDQGELVWNNSRIAHADGEFITLDNLRDVNAGSPNTGDTIGWSGSQWVSVPNGLSNGNLAVTLNNSGTINTPLLIPKNFTAILDTAHMVSPHSLTSEDYWQFEIEFQVDPNGVVETMTDNLPHIYNPGYITGDIFRYTEADHGIPGFVFDITLNDVEFTVVHWTTNPSFSIPPTLPSTIFSAGALKLTSNTKHWTFGTTGILTLPAGGDILDSEGNSVLGGIEGLTVDQDGTRTNVGKSLTESENTVTSRLYVQPNQIGLESIADPEGPNNNSTGLLTVSNSAVELSLVEQSADGDSVVALVVNGSGIEIAQGDGVTTTYLTIDATHITGGGPLTIGNQGTESDLTLQSGVAIILEGSGGTLKFDSDGILHLGTDVGRIWADQDTGKVIIGDGFGPAGAPAMPSSVIEIGGDTNAFRIGRANGANNPSWTFGNDGNLQVPGNIISTDSNGLILGSNYDVYIIADRTDNDRTWRFDGAAGELILPNNGIIDPSDDNFEVRGIENVNFEANAVVNIYTDTSNNAYQWQFGDDGDLTFPDSTVQSTAYLGITNEHQDSARLIVGTNTAVKENLTVRVVANSGSLNVEVKYSNPSNNTSVSAFVAYPTVSNVYSGRITKVAANSVYDVFGNLTQAGDTISFTVTDHSYHKIYRVTITAHEMPGSGTVGEAYCIIETLKNG
jgi:hypothetical protein